MDREFKITVREGASGWIASCPALSPSFGTGGTMFEAIAKWHERIVMDAMDKFVREKKK